MRTPLALLLAVVTWNVAACNPSSSGGTAKPVTQPEAAAEDAAPPAAAVSASSGTGTSSGAPAKASSAPKVTDTFATPAGDLTVTPIHHATLLFRVAGKAIYLDPVSEGASYDDLPKADYVFITDIHPDHLDEAGLAKVRKPETVLAGPPAVNEKTRLGVVLKNGDSHDFGAFRVDAVPMYNLVRGPAAGKLYHDKGRGDGFVFTFGKAGAGDAGSDGGSLVSRVYVSGDTECTPEMRALKNIDVAFVCMNLPYTMPPAEAAACVNAFRPKVLFPYHHRGSNLAELTSAIPTGSGVEVRERPWY